MRSSAAKSLLPVFFAFLVVALSAFPAHSDRQEMNAMAQTPPMGWNSWDSWGLTIDEPQFRDSVTWFHNHLQRFSWQYVVIDEGWFAQHPENPVGHMDYTMSEDGRYMPALNRFPSAAGGKGFRPLADWVHSLGLKFGIHIIRGIPREAVARNLRIAGSHFTAAEAADTSDTCSWNSDNYGLKNNKAAQAWYDSVIDLYARWGVDYLKVDCISRPWKADEIHMIHDAILRSERPIVLSLSPGPTPLADADDAVRSAQLWRISDDMWDLWSKPPGAPEFPQSLKNQFALLAAWNTSAGPGHWPDADMLPIGYLGPKPGWGPPRQTRLTRDEVRTMMTLWCIARSPLFIGTNLLKMDSFTESVLTSPELIAVDQYAEDSHPVIQKPDSVAWMASAPDHAGDYIAVFNLSDQPQTISYSWQELGIQYGKFPVRDLWERTELGRLDHIQATLPPHASKLFEVLYHQ
ncbi:MAG TPA: glycoside hydrolase family 27 protein [Acidobacteriaceae bacterium]|nr:glycoside hydrolase family 27 protein [Acidobacteriaceae bacterium]